MVSAMVLEVVRGAKQIQGLHNGCSLLWQRVWRVSKHRE